MNPNPKPGKFPAIGTASPNVDTRAFMPKKQEFDADTAKARVCNAAMPNAAPGELSKLTTPVMRPGSDHSGIKSRGQGC